MTPHRLARPVPVGYALFGTFFLSERLLRQGAEAASVQTAPIE